MDYSQMNRIVKRESMTSIRLHVVLDPHEVGSGIPEWMRSRHLGQGGGGPQRDALRFFGVKAGAHSQNGILLRIAEEDGEDFTIEWRLLNQQRWYNRSVNPLKKLICNPRIYLFFRAKPIDSEEGERRGRLSRNPRFLLS